MTASHDSQAATQSLLHLVSHAGSSTPLKPPLHSVTTEPMVTYENQRMPHKCTEDMPINVWSRYPNNSWFLEW